MKNDADWGKAAKLCRLSQDELRMARELGFNPRNLIKNIPSPSQRWKAPVADWVRNLYEKKMRKAARTKRVTPPPAAAA
jgi:hypothetical protein